MDMPVALRPAAVEDEPFLLEVYASTRLEELDLTPWDQAQREAFVRMQFNAQGNHYQVNFPEAEHQVILFNSDRVGRLYIARLERTIRILDVTILPARRNAGIGTSILTGILKESEETAKPVHIYVESFNPSLRLFERLGFRKVDASDYNLLMEWKRVLSSEY
jgi:GNAT superfamily N-acetyltransferase